VQGNYIGADKTGSAALGNGGDGVSLQNGAHRNTIGGTTAGAANLIAFNAGAGVTVDGTAAPTNGDSILRNSIFSNAGLGIALLAGGNDSQPAPAITSVATNSTTTTITGTLSGSAASTQFRIEAFASPGCDPSGAGEGKTFLKAATVTTNGSGIGSYTIFVPALAAGQAITATATNLNTKDTSQFSTCATS
jgi:trimeric autotransporter adhesin